MRISSKATYLSLLMSLLFFGTTWSQPDSQEEKHQLVTFVNRYIKSCGEDIRQKLDTTKRKEFVQLFVSEFEIPNDFRGGERYFPNANIYYEEFIHYFHRKTRVSVNSIVVGGKDGVLYAKDGNLYKVWIKKEFDYVEPPGNPKKYPIWLLLTIGWSTPAKSFKITKIRITSQMKDEDKDQIADAFDDCADTDPAFPVDMKGCGTRRVAPPANDTRSAPVHEIRKDSNGVIDNTRNNVRFDHYPASPAQKPDSIVFKPSRFYLAFSFGSFFPLTSSSAFTRRQILDYTTHQWKPDGGGLAWPVGYSIRLSGRYMTGKWLGIVAGYQGFFDLIDDRQLEIEVKNYLGMNKIPYKSAGVWARGYHLQAVYGGLSASYAKGWRHSLNVELTAGRVFTGFVFRNRLQMTIEYPDSVVSQSLSLSYPSYTILGSRINYEFNFRKGGELGLFLCAEYQYGRSSQPARSLTFTRPAGTLSIPASAVNWPGVTLGLRYHPGRTIRIPR